MGKLIEQCRFAQRTGLRRDIPVFGNTEPLQVGLSRINKHRETHEFSYPLAPTISELAYVSALDMVLMLDGPWKWEDERAQIAKETESALFSDSRIFSLSSRGEPSLNDTAVEYVVEGCLGKGKRFMSGMELIEMWKTQGMERNVLALQRIEEIGLSILGSIASGYDYWKLLDSLPSERVAVPNPAVIRIENTSMLVGSIIGLLGGAVIDIKWKDTIPQKLKYIIPLITGILGLLSGYGAGQLATGQMADIVYKTQYPLDEYAWTIPFVCIAGGVVGGVPRILKNKRVNKAKKEVFSRPHHTRNRLAAVADSLSYMQALQDHTDTNKENRSYEQWRAISRLIKSDKRLVSFINTYAQKGTTEEREKYWVVAADDMDGLSMQVFLADTLRYIGGIAEGPIYIPEPEKLFTVLDEQALLLSKPSVDLFHALLDSQDAAGALSSIFPGFAPILETKRMMEGEKAHTKVYTLGQSRIGPNICPHMVTASIQRMYKQGTIKDPAEQVLGLFEDTYSSWLKKGEPDHIYREPAYVKLAKLYGAIYTDTIRESPSEQKTTPSFHHQVFDAVASLERTNPYVGLVVKADITTALRLADSLLVGVGEETREAIKYGLDALRASL